MAATDPDPCADSLPVGETGSSTTQRAVCEAYVIVPEGEKHPARHDCEATRGHAGYHHAGSIEWEGNEANESDVFDEARAERVRAHAKHGGTSMESSAPDTLRRLAILTEEVGEVAREFNDAEHDGRPVNLVRLRKELIQTAAMAGAWADACEVLP